MKEISARDQNHFFSILKPKTAFVLTFVLLGFDIVSGLIVIATVTMIIIDTYGMCSLWGVDFNALTLINLIAAIGLSIEFTGLYLNSPGTEFLA